MLHNLSGFMEPNNIRLTGPGFRGFQVVPSLKAKGACSLRPCFAWLSSGLSAARSSLRASSSLHREGV